MPYNVKNETPTITKKIERCVKECMMKPLKRKKKYIGRSKKSSCIAICKASITGKKRGKKRK